MERYKMNMNSFSQEELNIIMKKKICIIGLGGLGGYVSQNLARFGVGSLTLVDYDVFQLSNLNRQIFATEDNINKKKVLETKRFLKKINSSLNINVVDEKLTSITAEEILSDHDLIFDCLDNVSSRFVLDEYSKKLNIPYIHGGIGGFYGQVSTVFPDDFIINILYPHGNDTNVINKKLGNPSFIPQIISGIQCSEGLKLLCGRKELLSKKLLFIDVLNNSFEVINIG